MNENYIEKYVDADGNVTIRQFSDKFLTLVFAGTKFTLDRVLALLGLIILSPLMLILSIIIKLESKGPVFFKQTRTGKGGKNITIYKFRTMKEDNDVHDFTTKDELTRVGKVLRKTSLDELPQLISILTGDMSFIGPRPWIPDYFDNMNDIQRHRYCRRPGLTGLAQVNGRNAITIFDKIKYDLEYIENYSFTQDIKIVFLTVKAVFGAKGVDAGKGGIKKDISDLKKYNKKVRGR